MGQHLGVYLDFMPLVQHQTLLLPGLVAPTAERLSRNVPQSSRCSVSSLLRLVFQQGLRGWLARVLQAQLRQLKVSQLLSAFLTGFHVNSPIRPVGTASHFRGWEQSTVWWMAVRFQSTCLPRQILTLHLIFSAQINTLTSVEIPHLACTVSSARGWGDPGLPPRMRWQCEV